MEKRSIFQKIFGGLIQKTTANFQRFRLMNGFTPTFSSFGNNAYASDVVRSTIHAIAVNVAKLKPKHIMRKNGKINNQYSLIEKLLSVRPNPHMNAYDFYYKIATQLYLRSNAFILIQYEGFNLKGFYPINCSTAEMLENDDVLYIKFTFSSGKMLTVPYDQVVHLRRYFNRDDMFGDSIDIPLLPTLELINTTNEGIINAIKSSAFLRGLLKFTTMLKPEDLKKQRDDFVTDYMDVSNNGGIAAIDNKADYTELKNDPKMVDSKQMDLIEKKVYKFFNVNEKIIMSNYTEDEWNAFYESIVEPLAIQMSLEFTSKLFTDREKGHGNELIFEANRLQYASTSTKLDTAETLFDRGVLNRNEIREIFNMGPIPDGDKYYVSLNYVQSDKANEYQLGAQPKVEPKEDDEIAGED